MSRLLRSISPPKTHKKLIWLSFRVLSTFISISRTSSFVGALAMLTLLAWSEWGALSLMASYAQEPARALETLSSKRGVDPDSSAQVEINMRVIDLNLGYEMVPVKKKLRDVRRGWIGLECEERVITYEGAPHLSLRVTHLDPSGPASLTPLKRGDLLVMIEGKPITHSHLYSHLSRYSNDTLTLSYLRGSPLSNLEGDEAYKTKDLKSVMIKYQRSISAFVIQVAGLIAKLERHRIEVKRFPRAAAAQFLPALIDESGQLKCNSAGRELLALSESWRHAMGTQGEEYPLQAGDVIILEDPQYTLITLFGGDTVCLPYTNKWLGSVATHQLTEFIDELTLDYRRQLVKR